MAVLSVCGVTKYEAAASLGPRTRRSRGRRERAGARKEGARGVGVMHLQAAGDRWAGDWSRAGATWPALDVSKPPQPTEDTCLKFHPWDSVTWSKIEWGPEPPKCRRTSWKVPWRTPDLVSSIFIQTQWHLLGNGLIYIRFPQTINVRDADQKFTSGHS